MTRIVVVGSSNTDLIVRADRLPAPGETVLGGDLITAPGGKGANQAVAAARLGAEVTFVARVGKDMFGEAALENFRREGIDTRFVIQDATAPSGVALIVVGQNGQNIIAVAPGANRRLTPNDVHAAESAFAGARVVLLQLETPMETVVAAARAGRSAGATVILNPAPAQTLPNELYSLIDIVTPNESEAALLTGEATPEAAARILLQRGVKSVIVTLGEAGVLVAASPDDIRRAPGFDVNVVDTTAAGDAFNGGLAAALARGESSESALSYSQAVAAISVTRMGAQPSLPTEAEVRLFVRDHPHSSGGAT
ncbi:MAG TPA: ribokinase [Anaerolineales bacterium]|nr:ribokinase [Anaerolineales bacterium]